MSKPINLPIPAKRILTKRLEALTDVPLAGLVDDLGRDLGRIEKLIDALTQYKADVFENGIANLRITYREVPIVTGTDRDTPIVRWKFEDRFRPRSFELQFNLETTEFSATGEEKIDPSPARPTTIEVTSTMLAQLQDRVPRNEIDKVQDLVLQWQEKHPSTPKLA